MFANVTAACKSISRQPGQIVLCMHTDHSMMKLFWSCLQMLRQHARTLDDARQQHNAVAAELAAVQKEMIQLQVTQWQPILAAFDQQLEVGLHTFTNVNVYDYIASIACNHHMVYMHVLYFLLAFKNSICMQGSKHNLKFEAALH